MQDLQEKNHELSRGIPFSLAGLGKTPGVSAAKRTLFLFSPPDLSPDPPGPSFPGFCRRGPHRLSGVSGKRQRSG